MNDQVIPDGTYTVMGPGGQLTDVGGSMVLLQPGYGAGDAQQWTVAFGSGGYTLRNVGTSRYLGNDGDPDQPTWMVKGTSQPFAWQLSAGDDDDPSTYLLTSAASGEGLRLAPSILRIWPPQVAIAPPAPAFNFEWTFQPA